MELASQLAIARALHVLGVVLWIGGVAFVTLILIPALRKECAPEERLPWFERLENRFSWQAKWVTVLTGLSGFFMVAKMDLAIRFQTEGFWWMHGMVMIWLIFTVVLFLLEPLFLHRLFHRKAEENPEQAFKWLHRMHWVLLSLSLLVVAGAVTGVH